MSTRLWVGGLEAGTAERDLEDEFSKFGRLRSVWVARKPPGFAFVEFEDTRDADDAVRKLDGYQPPAATNPWRVEVSRKGEPRRGGPPGGGGYSDRGPPPARGEAKCYSCGEFGHFARECRNEGGGGGGGGGGMRGGGGGRGGDRGGDRYDSRGGGGYDRDGGRDRYAPDNRRRSPEYEGRSRRRSPSYDRARSPSR